MVATCRHVIAVVGADRSRVAPVYAALVGGLVNVLITDHITAQVLLERKQKGDFR
jgi:DNA-binding transcriptional regulator LsrR (DeoR family)